MLRQPHLMEKGGYNDMQSIPPNTFELWPCQIQIEDRSVSPLPNSGNAYCAPYTDADKAAAR